MHLIIHREPMQARGFGLPADTVDLMKQSGTLARATAWLEVLYRMLAVRVRKQGRADRSGTGDTVRPSWLAFNLRRPAMPQLAPDETLETLQGVSLPTNPMMANEYLSAQVAAPLGLSRLALTGDAANSNYSAARLSTETDRRTWSVYRRILIDATEPVYQAFRAAYADEELPEVPQWRGPPAIVMEPVKIATSLRVLVESGIISREEARAELGYPPGAPQGDTGAEE